MVQTDWTIEPCFQQMLGNDFVESSQCGKAEKHSPDCPVVVKKEQTGCALWKGVMTSDFLPSQQ